MANLKELLEWWIKLVPKHSSGSILDDLLTDVHFERYST